MNKADRKQIATVFRKAKKLLWNGRGVLPWYGYTKSEYICHAIDATDRTDEEKDAAKDIILARIRPNGSFDGWLERQLGVKKEDMTLYRVQKHRHAWLDMLIKEFSK
jgi:hypothetical protein